jgi:hypothetical protein
MQRLQSVGERFSTQVAGAAGHRSLSVSLSLSHLLVLLELQVHGGTVGAQLGVVRRALHSLRIPLHTRPPPTPSAVCARRTQSGIGSRLRLRHTDVRVSWTLDHGLTLMRPLFGSPAAPRRTARTRTRRCRAPACELRARVSVFHARALLLMVLRAQRSGQGWRACTVMRGVERARGDSTRALWFSASATACWLGRWPHVVQFMMLMSLSGWDRPVMSPADTCVGTP